MFQRSKKKCRLASGTAAQQASGNNAKKIALQRAIESYKSMMVLEDYNVAESFVNSTGSAGKQKKAGYSPRTLEACNTAGFSYCEAMRGVVHPIVNRHYRKFALAHTIPCDKDEWMEEVIDDMVESIEEGMQVLTFTREHRYHKQGNWGVTNSGCAFGGR